LPDVPFGGALGLPVGPFGGALGLPVGPFGGALGLPVGPFGGALGLPVGPFGGALGLPIGPFGGALGLPVRCDRAAATCLDLPTVAFIGSYSPINSAGTANTTEASNSSFIGSPNSRKTLDRAAMDSSRKRLFICTRNRSLAASLRDSCVVIVNSPSLGVARQCKPKRFHGRP